MVQGLFIIIIRLVSINFILSFCITVNIHISMFSVHLSQRAELSVSAWNFSVVMFVLQNHFSDSTILGKIVWPHPFPREDNNEFWKKTHNCPILFFSNDDPFLSQTEDTKQIRTWHIILLWHTFKNFKWTKVLVQCYI